jgi:uncharacterized protein (DUF952 family)
MLIYRTSKRKKWQQAQKDGFYTDESLNNEGFIPMSERQQVMSVANHLYKGQKDLVLLVVDTEKLESEVRYEQLGTNEPFPHIYGVINLDAVTDVLEFSFDSNSFFTFPNS